VEKINIQRGDEMPICSYVVNAVEGSFSDLQQELSEKPGCEAYPSDEQEVIVLVTDTPTKEADKQLYNELKDNDKISCIAISFADIPEGEDD
jgi:nitrate reductase NapAB chaperone NapD